MLHRLARRRGVCRSGRLWWRRRQHPAAGKRQSAAHARCRGDLRPARTNDYFSHTSLDGRTLAQRIDASGYAWSSVGENIAAGQASVNEVIDGWIASPGHCANIMDPGFVQLGLACVRGTASSTYGTYWTMDLARPR